LGADEGVFAAHQVQVARPQQMVVLALGERRQVLDAEPPAARAEPAASASATGQTGSTILPIEAFSGLRHFKDLDTAVLRRDGWKATICAYDAFYRDRTTHCTGGTLSALYHDRIGSICTAGISDYVMWEPHNMQRHRDAVLRPLTPRLEYEDGGKTYASHINPECTLECPDGRIDARGTLVDAQGDHPAEASPLPYAFTYSVEAGIFRIDIRLSDTQRLPRFILPVWKHEGSGIESMDGATVCIRGPEHQLSISLEGSAQWLADPETIFNHVPGAEAFELVCRMLPGAPGAGKPTASIRIAVVLGPAGKDGQALPAALNSTRVSEPVLDALERVVAARGTDLLAAKKPEPYGGQHHGA